VQAPDTQVWPELQDLPHMPQLLKLSVSSVSHPAAKMLDEQSPYPVAHWNVQAPAMHAGT
jgi:uncharacterized membrane protein